MSEKICKHCKKYGFVNDTHHRVHEEWCDYQNPTYYETKSGAGVRRLSGRAIANNWQTIWKYIKKVNK